MTMHAKMFVRVRNIRCEIGAMANRTAASHSNAGSAKCASMRRQVKACEFGVMTQRKRMPQSNRGAFTPLRCSVNEPAIIARCTAIVILACAFFSSATSTASAQVIDSLDRSPSIGDTISSDLEAFGADALTIATSPSRWDATDWALAGGSAAMTGALMTIDDDVRSIAQRNRSETGQQFADVGNTFGEIGVALALSGGTYLTGLAFDLPHVRRAGRHVAQSLVYAAVITTSLKFIVGRERPEWNGGQFVFNPFATSDRFYSIPSGHTTVAFAIASSLSADIDHPAATIALYGLAALTAGTRVYVDRHWTSDVFLGAVFGGVIGYTVANLDNVGAAGSSLMIVPGVDRLTLVYRFQ